MVQSRGEQNDVRHVFFENAAVDHDHGGFNSQLWMMCHSKEPFCSRVLPFGNET